MDNKKFQKTHLDIDFASVKSQSHQEDEIIDIYKKLILDEIDTSILRICEQLYDATILDLYTPIDTFFTTPSIGKKIDHGLYDLRDGRENIVDVIIHNDCKKLLIFGDVGTGKSTLINYITYYAFTNSSFPYFVIRLPLKECIFDKDAYQNIDDILNVISIYLLSIKYDKNHISNLIKLIKNYLKEKVLVLIDGFDELPNDQNYLERFFSWFNNFSYLLNKDSKIILTTRSYETDIIEKNIDNLEFAKLAEFNENQIYNFLLNYFKIQYKNEQNNNTLAVRGSESLFNLIRKSDKLRELSTNPLLLTLLFSLYIEKGELTDNKIKLYDYSLELLIKKWKNRGSIKQLIGITYESLINIISKIAHDNLVQNGQITDLTYSEIVTTFSTELPDNINPKVVVDILFEKCGLLIKTSNDHIKGFPATYDKYNFIHKSFKEYLAALYVINNIKEYDVSLFDSNIDKMSVSFNFFIGLLSNHSKFYFQSIIGGMIEEFCNQSLIQIGKSICDYNLNDYLGQKRLNHLLDNLSLIANDFSNTIDIRMQSCDILGFFCYYDKLWLKEAVTSIIKKGKSIPCIDWISIPASNSCKEFFISKFPITNHQFKFFISDNGYNNKKYWDIEGSWEWREGDAIDFCKVAKLDYEKERYIQYCNWQNSRPKERRMMPFWWEIDPWGNSLNPVIGICWYEACAFTKWLSSFYYDDGYVIDLPTMEEWQRAFGFDVDANGWCWGMDWDNNFANTKEGNIQRPTTIGIFSKKSILGGEDACGNVYEWTKTKLTKQLINTDGMTTYDYDVDNEDIKIVMGGAWCFDKNFAKIRSLNWDYPYVFDQNTGFRIIKRNLG